MPFGRSVLLAASRSQRLNDFALRSKFVKRATRKFMPGEHADDALQAGVALAASGRGLIFTKLGEAITSADAAVAVRDDYLRFFDQIRALRLPAHVSVKPTQLGLDLSFADCERHLLALAAKAEETRSALWLDMEDSSYVDRTLDLYVALKKLHPSTGVALQAYLRRTPDDLARLMSLKPVIRLVKGAYDEPSEKAFAKKSDTDRAYYDLATQMLEATRRDMCAPVFGTHDLGLIARIVDQAAASGVGKQKYQIHMLYGIRDSAQRHLVAEGHIVKTLVSYGSAWYRWYMRRLAERPANVLFVARSLFG
ncbi:MAG TPA: proline dehydrogenase family protein [Gemmatimonadaceae bacterium]|nr:proline dehydrogenase family protein [Gemmatimonadaceae bacterium]